MIDFYDIFYIVTGVFVLFSWYVLISAFAEKEEMPKNKIMLAMTIYFGVSNVMHYIAEIPLVNLALTIGLLSVLSAMMNFSKKKMILGVVYTTILLIAIDIVAAVMTGLLVDSLIQDTPYQSSLGRLVTIILVYALGMGIRNFRNIRRNLDIPNSYWITLVTFPILSIGILLMMLRFSRHESDTVIIMSVMIIGMNVIVFSLYDRLMAMHSRQVEDLALGYLNDSYRKQLDTMKGSVNSVHSIQHDITRHLISLATLLQGEKYRDAGEYIDAIKAQFTKTDLLSKTGNDIVDSIINFEVQYSGIQRNRISINTLQVPEEMAVSDYELTVVLSNLLRNALQAAARVADGTVNLRMDYRQGMLHINISNDFDGVIRERGGKLLSRHESDESRGYGLENVRNVVTKNHGELNITKTDNRFSVDVLLYVRAEAKELSWKKTNFNIE